jgi:hypothetical protein
MVNNGGYANHWTANAQYPHDYMFNFVILNRIGFKGFLHILHVMKFIYEYLLLRMFQLMAKNMSYTSDFKIKCL